MFMVDFKNENPKTTREFVFHLREAGVREPLSLFRQWRESHIIQETKEGWIFTKEAVEFFTAPISPTLH